MERTSPKVKSADRVLDIFELFTGEKDSYTLSEIAKELNMPFSSTHQLLQNMLSRGYLESDSSGKFFHLGYKLFEIRVQHRKNTSLTEQFFYVAGKMVEELNESVFLGVRSHDKVVYIAEKQVPQPFRFSTTLGSVLPLHASASGKILLSRLSEDQLDLLYPGKNLEPFTATTISSLDALKAELDKVRSDEIAYNRGESIEGVNCIAGPIFDMEGQIVASVSVSIPEIRITDELWDKAHYWVRRSCQEITNRMYRQN